MYVITIRCQPLLMFHSSMPFTQTQTGATVPLRWLTITLWIPLLRKLEKLVQIARATRKCR
jgi:hypothetical protein